MWECVLSDTEPGLIGEMDGGVGCRGPGNSSHPGHFISLDKVFLGNHDIF
jgi:hypothetical protein